MTASGKQDGEEVKENGTYWIVTKGNKFAVVGLAESDLIPEMWWMTAKQYDETVENITESFWDTDDAVKCSAFKFTIENETYTCTGAIVFAVVGGVVELALLSFATLSVIFFLQDKKKKA